MGLPRFPGIFQKSLTRTGMTVRSLKSERSAQSGHKPALRPCAIRVPEGAMSEAEFNLMLDAVRNAMIHEDFAPAPEEDLVHR